MKKAAKIVSWIGGAQTVVLLWIIFVIAALKNANSGSHSDIRSLITIMLFLIPLILTGIIIAILIWRDRSVNSGYKKVCGIVTMIFVSLLGGILTLAIPKNVLGKPDGSRRFNFRGSLCIPYGLFMILFVVLPLLLIFYFSFTDENGVFSLENWATIFTQAHNWRVIGITFLIAAITTVICVLIGFPVAYLLSNKKYNKNKVLVYIFLLPMWINFVIRTIGLKALVNGLSQSIFGVDLTASYPYLSIVIGMVYDYLPFAILPLYNQMLKMDKNQIEAAADLGANPAQVFVKNIIPMTIPGIVSACMMTFMPTMSSYVIANKMSENNVQIIGNLIEQWFGTNVSAISNHVGSTLSLVMLAIIGLSLIIEKAATRKDDSRKVGIW